MNALNITDSPDAPLAVACSDLLCRLVNHRAAMAPHQKELHAGKLLVEATEAIAKLIEQLAASDALHLDTLRQRNKLRDRVIQYIKDHDQDENSTVDELKFALDETEW
jgi:hypothetical protein